MELAEQLVELTELFAELFTELLAELLAELKVRVKLQHSRELKVFNSLRLSVVISSYL